MILPDDGNHKEQAYEIWQRNFHDPVLYAKFYFKEVYGHNKVYFNVSEDGETIRGMIHLNPYTLVSKNIEQKAHYLVGISTQEEYRRQGVMRELLHRSLSDMREDGEPFTYLMPADEAYYLPFDFRFGMNLIEQELHYEKRPESEKNTSLTFMEYKDCMNTSGHDSIHEICQKECRIKREDFTLFTKITPDYLKRMSDEMESDYGKMFFVFEKGEYVGRFVAAQEYGYLLVSQIFCADSFERLEFLRSILDFLADQYGNYGSYQLSFDESWEKDLLSGGPYGTNRLMPKKSTKMIMFRILNIEAMAPFLSVRAEDKAEEEKIYIKITDPFLAENTGIYEFSLKDAVSIRKINENPPEAASYANTDMAGLTQILFGDKTPEEVFEAATDQKVFHFFKQIGILNKNCILEIV